MATITQLMNRIDNLNLNKIAAESMRETKKDFVEWQQEQLDQGKKKTGGSITPFYKPATIRIKKEKGQPIDRVTLKDTGFFYNSIFLVVKESQKAFAAVSSDVKSKWLLSRYGENILGLGGVYKAGYVSDVRPVYMRKISDVIKLSVSS